MIDGVTNGNGDSRYLKSNISPSTTLAELIALFNAGEFPVDFNGINEDGWTTLATALNKANLMDDTTSALLETNLDFTFSGDTPTINEAFYQIAAALTGGATVEAGSYVGTGVYGSGNKNSLELGADTKLLFIMPESSYYSGYFVAPYSSIRAFTLSTSGASYLYPSASGDTLYWYNTSSAAMQLNESGKTYNYIAIGVPS